MSIPLNDLLFQIRTLLFVGSLSLLVGSIIGLFTKSRWVSEDWFSPFTRDGHASANEDEPYHEKRRARRVPSNALFELKNTAGEFMSSSAYLYDISLQGARFDSPFVFKEGNRIQARLHSSKEGLLNISARIVWLQQKRDRILYGVEFKSVVPGRP